MKPYEPADDREHLPNPADMRPLETTFFTRVAECWKSIGVIGGDQTCAELKQFVHCRNCPVYAEAGAKLLDRALPAGYRELWTRRLAERKADAAAGKKSVVIFRIGGDWLALPTQVFLEVTEERVIRSLPHSRNDFLLGLVNVRGELLLCFSLPRLLGFNVSASLKDRRQTAGRLLVVGRAGQRQTFPVDEVIGIHRYQPQEIKATSAFVPGVTFLSGQLKWEGRAVQLLNEEKVFSTFNQQLA